MKLNVGDVIQVIGWVMLKGLKGGSKYRVNRIRKHSGKFVYCFSKARGRKEVIHHFVSDVDICFNNYCKNRIEKV